MSKSKCYGCEERATGCHVVCDIGIAQDLENSIKREEMAKKKAVEAALGNLSFEKGERIRKRGNRLLG